MLRVKNLGKDIVKKKMNKNKSGQALAEFVLILPIILMILFIVIDLANVFYNKNKLESTTDTIVSYIESGKSSKLNKFIKDEDVTYTSTSGAGEYVITVKKDVVLSTPFADMFFDNPYTIKTKRVVLYE